MKSENQTFKNKIISSFLWLFSGTIFIQIISWVSTIIVIRLLSPADYGLMAMTLPVLFLIQMLSSWGLGTALVQDKELNDTKIRQLFGFIILIYSSAFILIYLFAPIIASFFHEERIISLLRLLCVNLIFMALYMIPDSILFREMNFKAKTKVDVCSRLVAAIVAPVCALNSLGVWSLAIAEISYHLIRALSLNIIYKKYYKPIFSSFNECKSLIKFGMMVSGTVFFIYLFNQADKIIVGKFLGKELLGFYAVAFSLALLPKEKIMPIITQLSFSAYSMIQDDVDRIKSSLLKTIEFIALLAFPLFWGMSCVSGQFIPLILGKHWEKAIVPFEYLCIIIPLLTITPIYPTALNAIGKPLIVFKNTLIETSLLIIAIFIGIKYDLIGISVAWVCFYPIAFVIISQRSLKALNIGMKELLLCLKFPVLSSLAMSILVISTKKLLTYRINSIILLLILIVMGMAVYTSLIFIFKRVLLMDIKRIISSKSFD